MSQGPHIPIFDALSSPPQVMGCERRWLVLSASVASMIAGPAGLFAENLTMFVTGIGLFSVAAALGRRWTEDDAQFREVRVEAFRYERTYCATSRWDVRVRPARSWT